MFLQHGRARGDGGRGKAHAAGQPTERPGGGPVMLRMHCFVVPGSDRIGKPAFCCNARSDSRGPQATMSTRRPVQAGAEVVFQRNRKAASPGGGEGRWKRRTISFEHAMGSISHCHPGWWSNDCGFLRSGRAGLCEWQDFAGHQFRIGAETSVAFRGAKGATFAERKATIRYFRGAKGDTFAEPKTTKRYFRGAKGDDATFAERKATIIDSPVLSGGFGDFRASPWGVG